MSGKSSDSGSINLNLGGNVKLRLAGLLGMLGFVITGAAGFGSWLSTNATQSDVADASDKLRMEIKEARTDLAARMDNLEEKARERDASIADIREDLHDQQESTREIKDQMGVLVRMNLSHAPPATRRRFEREAGEAGVEGL